MSRTHKDSPHSRNNRPRSTGRQRNISVRGIRRDPPDLRKFSRALIQLALDEAAAAKQSTLDPTTGNRAAGSADEPKDPADG